MGRNDMRVDEVISILRGVLRQVRQREQDALAVIVKHRLKLLVVGSLFTLEKLAQGGICQHDIEGGGRVELVNIR